MLILKSFTQLLMVGAAFSANGKNAVPFPVSRAATVAAISPSSRPTCDTLEGRGEMNLRVLRLFNASREGRPSINAAAVRPNAFGERPSVSSFSCCPQPVGNPALICRVVRRPYVAAGIGP